MTLSRIEQLEVLQETVEFFVARKKFPEMEYSTVVLYDGNHSAKTMVVARDLGEQEIKLKKPLIGPAGSLFRDVSKELNFIPEKDFFLCNTVPLKPIGNKAFSQEVRNQMRWVLQELINIVQPKYFLTLGKEATEWFGLEVNRMGDLQGKEFNVNGVWLYPSYHPSYIKRLLNKGVDGKEDLKKSLLLLKKRRNINEHI